jgi:hypothetical protein
MVKVGCVYTNKKKESRIDSYLIGSQDLDEDETLIQ